MSTIIHQTAAITAHAMLVYQGSEARGIKDRSTRESRTSKPIVVDKISRVLGVTVRHGVIPSQDGKKRPLGLLPAVACEIQRTPVSPTFQIIRSPSEEGAADWLGVYALHSVN